MQSLDKLATQLKYSCQKQDVAAIKGLVGATQQRWERVGLRVAERSRQLDSGYKEAKMFLDSWQVRSHPFFTVYISRQLGTRCLFHKTFLSQFLSFCLS